MSELLERIDDLLETGGSGFDDDFKSFKIFYENEEVDPNQKYRVQLGDDKYWHQRLSIVILHYGRSLIYSTRSAFWK